jgi:hypothetical protein
MSRPPTKIIVSHNRNGCMKCYLMRKVAVELRISDACGKRVPPECGDELGGSRLGNHLILSGLISRQ